MIPLPPSFPAPSFPPGDVWLASAGPGDRRLLTLLAAHALRSTDDIVHDARVDRRDLDPARDGASIVYAGKRGGTRAHAISSPAVIVGGTAGLRPEIASGLAGWT